MWDALAVTLIVVAAIAYLVRRQMKKKASDGCGCSAGCGGCGSSGRHISSKPSAADGGDCCGGNRK